MKILNLLLIGSCVGLLSACNSGSNGSTGSDVQNPSASGSVSGVGQFSISATVTGCRVIASGNSCSVNVSYSGTGSYSGSKLQLSNLQPNYYTYSNLSSNCPYASTAQATTCTFNIVSVATSTPAEIVTLSMGGAPATNITFTVGGGM